MRAIKISFTTVEDDKKESLEREYLIDVDQLRNAVTPLLPIAAYNEAQKFWEAVVQMGKLDDL